MRTHAVKTNIAMIRWLLYCCWANASWHITANNFIVTKRWKERKKKRKDKKNLNEFSVKDRKKREKRLLSGMDTLMIRWFFLARSLFSTIYIFKRFDLKEAKINWKSSIVYLYAHSTILHTDTHERCIFFLNCP